MRSNRVLSTIDFHTAGIGMRLLTSGLGPLPGSTIGEKRRGFQERLDQLRTGLCLEPRGHRGLLIAVMTEPVTPGAHFGLFFIYPGGYYVSCGEGTIGAATVAIETGMVARLGAETPVTIDTEAGVVETIARSDGDRVREVTLRWTPSFVVLAGQSVEVESVGEVPVDVAPGPGRRGALRKRNLRAHGALLSSRSHAGGLHDHEPGPPGSRFHGPRRRRDRGRGPPRDPSRDHGHLVPHRIQSVPLRPQRP